MAWLDKRGQSYRVVFQIGGQTFKRSLGTTDPREADGRLAAVERRLAMVERGEISVPDDVDLPTFLVSNGHRPQSVTVAKSLTLAEFFARFRAALPEGAMEANSLDTVNLHLKHLERVLKSRTPIKAITFERLQDYVNSRSADAGLRGQSLSPTTIKKELGSFSSVWNWGLRMGHVSVPFPSKGLRYPKSADKPPFQTWAEIERQIACGGLSETQQAALWDCLYLRTSEIMELLSFVRRRNEAPCLYPMLVMAAYTGARRSEITRTQKRDVDFEAGMILVHEKKRSKGRRTHRMVPMTEQLSNALKTCLAGQSGPAAFTEEGMPVTPKRATELLVPSLAGSKWEKLRGWHVLRHSFISNLASRGVDQRLIDEFVGHNTEAMRRRYRHLFPETKREAITAVFG